MMHQDTLLLLLVDTLRRQWEDILSVVLCTLAVMLFDMVVVGKEEGKPRRSSLMNSY